MALKIEWRSPEEITITKVEINRSTSIYGTYSVVTEINATSDGNIKSSSNTWVTSYTDSTGNRNYWYKIRFYDGAGSTYSDYSEPITAEELFRLCTVDEVKKEIDTVGKWNDDEIFDAITGVDDLIYVECGTPLQAVVSDVLYNEDGTTLNDLYYVGEENIYRVDRVFYGTTTKSELFMDDEFKVNNSYGMVKILPVASSSVSLSSDAEVEIRYVPRIYHQLSLYRTCKSLLSRLDYNSDGKPSKEYEMIYTKVKTVETLLNQRVGLQLSSDLVNYDCVYGVGVKRLVQDVDRNKYIGRNNRW